jgi:predicted AlkP superfamily pyrophosphatase or phosphodiesterase
MRNFWFLAVVAGLWAGVRGAAADQPAEPPRLAVLIMVDQMRGDYLEAFRNHFGPGGLRRMMEEGAWFSHAYLPYGSTATGPGHASICTGTVPAVHGIVGNDWIEEAEDQDGHNCCTDKNVQPVPAPKKESKKGSKSPCWLLAPTVGDALKQATGGVAKVIAISLKDRSAILPGGKRADLATWWDTDSGDFVSSSYYGAQLPAWLAELNASHFADKFFQQKWELLLPVEAYSMRFMEQGPASEAYKHYNKGDFPKILGKKESKPGEDYYDALLASPFGNEVALEAGRRAIVGAQLGSDAVPDLLLIGLSSQDVIGHFYGPDSAEVMDCVLRTDRQLAEFFSWLDEKIGKDRYIAALSSDHGVAPLPEYTVELGRGGGRLDDKKMEAFFAEKLAARFGSPPENRKYIRSIMLPWLIFDLKTLQERNVSVDEAARYLADIAREVPGILAAYTAAEILKPDFVSGDDVRQAVRNSTYPGRSGHVYLHWDRFWYKTGGNQAGHGSAYDYDQHVPVLFMGPGVHVGQYADRVSPTGMAATMAALLHIPPPEKADPPLRAALE